MKKSCYNHFFNFNERLYVINLLTSGILSFKKESYGQIINIINNPDSLYQSSNCNNGTTLKNQLYTNGFIIDDNVNELDLLMARHKISCSPGKKISYSMQIAITQQCNFRCTYCYEKHTSLILSHEKQNAILNFIEKNIANWNSLSITWFGGEPLLEPEIIEYLSKSIIFLCNKYSVKYSSIIVTNGYLLNKKNANILYTCQVKTAQITIDGDKKSHDQRRKLVNGNGSYDKIIANILNESNKFDYIIRLNVDDQSTISLESLLTILYPINKKVIFSFSQTNELEGDNIKKSSSLKDYSEKEIKLGKLALGHGFRVMTGAKFPGESYCPVYSDNILLIDSNGNITRCVSDTGESEKRMGYIENDGTIITSNPNSQYDFNPFTDDDCKNCNVLPICMGGCPKYSCTNKLLNGRCSIKENITTYLNQMILISTCNKQEAVN